MLFEQNRNRNFKPHFRAEKYAEAIKVFNYKTFQLLLDTF